MPSGVRRCLPSTISAPSLQLSTFRLPPPSPAPLPLSHFPSSLLSHCHTWPHQRKDNFTRSHCSTIPPFTFPRPSCTPSSEGRKRRNADDLPCVLYHFPTSPVLSRHTAATGTPFFPTLPASATTCLVPWGSTAHPTYPLPLYPPITQRRLAHISFPLSHYPSLVQPPTLRNDVTWGFSTSHFPTSHAHGDTANDSERSSFLRSHHPTPQRTPTPWGLGTSERQITLPLRYPSRERVGYLPPSILPLLGTRACTASFSWDAPPSHFPSFHWKSKTGRASSCPAP